MLVQTCRIELTGGGNTSDEQIDQIKDLQRQGYGPKEISARLGIDRKTTSKYMRTEDYSGGIPSRKAVPSKLDPWKAEIAQWLEEDRRMRFKQRHTAGIKPARLASSRTRRKARPIEFFV